MAEYTKSYRYWSPHRHCQLGHQNASEGCQRLAVESTEAYEDLMMSFIGEAVAEIHGTKVIYLNPDDF
jgi:hypothetical protein